ncbi:Crp/Fnr family transcriptional regulator [Pusillimonas soli]|uniref:Crp/Fnr family transcriptional regulator n=1 Tax=Allopusillimonas soli TaxID=659016 RepID=A0A853FF94_9BURK|nr:Crp/Fnr family transcriptional regulator [Allopusillimonas soli]
MSTTTTTSEYERFHIPAEWVAASSCFLDRLKPMEREQLLERADIQSFKRNTILFRAGISGDKLYILKSGCVKVFQLAATGREMILWFCMPGDPFGLASVPQMGPRLVFAQVRSDASVYCISRANFLDFLANHPRVSGELIGLLLGRLYLLSDTLLNSSSESTEEQLLRLLVRLQHQCGRHIGKEICIDIDLTQQEIADMIGASRQTVSSLLNQMQERGILRIHRRRIYLRPSAESS